MDLLVVVQVGQRVQHVATHVRDVRLGEGRFGTHNARQTAVSHVIHHDLPVRERRGTHPEIAFPVETVVDLHHVLAVADLLQNQFITDVHQIAHAGDFHGEDFLCGLLYRFVAGNKRSSENVHNAETAFADYLAQTEIVLFGIVFTNERRCSGEKSNKIRSWSISCTSLIILFVSSGLGWKL